MMETVAEINALWILLGKTSVFVGLVVGLVQGIRYLAGLMPSSKLARRAQDMETKLKTDFERLNEHDRRLTKLEAEVEETKKSIDQVNEGIQRLGRSQISLLNHLANGNGVDEMRNEAKDLTEFFISR